MIVPVAAILVSAGIALWVMSHERRRAERERIRAQAVDLIKALNAVGRAYDSLDTDDVNAANRAYEQELNAFAAHLNKHDVVVAKYVCVVMNQADNEAWNHMSRTALWIASSIELWLRGELSSKDFAKHMPADTTSWIEVIDLGDRGAVLRGLPATGIADLDPSGWVSAE